MGKGGKNKKTNGNTKSPSSAQISAKKAISQISEEDEKLLKLAKSIVKAGELDRNEFEKLLEADLLKEIQEKRKLQEAELEKEKQKRVQQIETEIKEQNKDLIQENKELQSQKDTLAKEILQAEKEIKEAEKKQKKLLENAENEAKKIVTDARKEAEKQHQEVLVEIKERQQELEEREDDVDTKEIELDVRKKQLDTKEKRLKKQEEVYDSANPEEVASLEKQLSLCKEQLEKVRAEYENVQLELNERKIAQSKLSGISTEELQELNTRLYEKIEQLEDKCNRYSEYELLEMKRALNAENEYLTKIKQQEIAIVEYKTELSRISNGQMEYEHLKSQLDLLRTLNEHLKGELDNTKKMLESSIGEICPALTSIDIQQTEPDGAELERFSRRTQLKADLNNISLPKLVKHVKNYAASRAKPLFYSERDLRAYIAGMASSHLAILQGMSGTGKTSLPKVFAEAVLGEINVVAVESSWRDRNELLGYYNDFSKKFTAKEFTCDLYKAGCENYKDTIYIIVLDEMNLSRVEYYFADFLSVLEDKPSNWKIKLVDTDLRQLPTEITKEVKAELEKQQSKEAMELRMLLERLYPNMKLCEKTTVSANDKLRLITYLSAKKFKNQSNTRYLVGGPQNLIDGNTIKIPSNVWFVGTANKDESTFEITDKVYDRAQVLEFNKRAKGTKVNEYMQPIFVSFDVLNKLFVKAQTRSTFEAETNTLLKEIEQILQANFRISYGNRISDQMNRFIPVYIAAGEGTGLSEEELLHEAIDYQLTHKVLRRLEYVEMNRDANKDAGDKLRKVFEKNGLTLAKEFMDWKLRGEE